MTSNALENIDLEAGDVAIYGPRAVRFLRMVARMSTPEELEEAGADDLIEDCAGSLQSLIVMARDIVGTPIVKREG